MIWKLHISSNHLIPNKVVKTSQLEGIRRFIWWSITSTRRLLWRLCRVLEGRWMKMPDWRVTPFRSSVTWWQSGKQCQINKKKNFIGEQSIISLILPLNTLAIMSFGKQRHQHSISSIVMLKKKVKPSLPLLTSL